MLKTGSEHLLTSARLICYTKRNYLFLHKTGSAATSSLASAIEGKKKERKKKMVQLHHPLPFSSPPHKLLHTFHLALFWATTPRQKDNPKKTTQDRCLSKTASSKRKKKKVCGSDYSVVLKQEDGEGGSACARVGGTEGDAAFRNPAASYSALRFFLMGLELLYGFNSACCTF